MMVDHGCFPESRGVNRYDGAPRLAATLNVEEQIVMMVHTCGGYVMVIMQFIVVDNRPVPRESKTVITC